MKELQDWVDEGRRAVHFRRRLGRRWWVSREMGKRRRDEGRGQREEKGVFSFREAGRCEPGGGQLYGRSETKCFWHAEVLQGKYVYDSCSIFFLELDVFCRKFYVIGETVFSGVRSNTLLTWCGLCSRAE